MAEHGAAERGAVAFDPATLRVMAVTAPPRGGAALTGAEAGAATPRWCDGVAAVSGGATCIQVRLKDVSARTLVEVTRAVVAQTDVPVLVNDRFDVALAAGAAGVHLGADDLPVAEVRRVTPPGFVIGASVGDDTEIANAALADYVGIGPISCSGSKMDAGEAIGMVGFARLAALVGTLARKPAVGIGGVTAATAGEVIRHGGAGVAAIAAIFGDSTDTTDPAVGARALRDAVDRGAISR